MQDGQTGKFYSSGLCTWESDILEISSRCKDAMNDSWRPYFHLPSIKFQHHHEVFPLSNKCGSSEALPNNGEPKLILQCWEPRGPTSAVSSTEVDGVFWAVPMNHCTAELAQKAVKGVLFSLYSLCVNVCCLYVCCICVSPLCNPSRGSSVTLMNSLLWDRLVLFLLLWFDTAVTPRLAIPSMAVNWLAGTQTRNIRHHSLKLESWQMERFWEMPRKWAHAEALCRSHFTSDRSNTHY